MNLFLHESLYRGAEAMQKLAERRLVLCGAGALGSLLADNLVRQGLRRLTAIDFDRVEEHNVGTQLYRREDVGAYKVEVLRAHCFRAAGVEIEAVDRRLDEQNVHKLLRKAEVVVDALDNSASRKIISEYCRGKALPCLHLGMNAGYGEVLWNETYRVPADTAQSNSCEVPLARDLILLVVAAGSEALLHYWLKGARENFSVTLEDLRINRE